MSFLHRVTHRMARQRPDRAVLRSYSPLLFQTGDQAQEFEKWPHKKLEELVSALLNEEQARTLDTEGVVTLSHTDDAGEFELKITRSADLVNGDVLFIVIEPKFYESVAPEEEGVLARLRALWSAK